MTIATKEQIDVNAPIIMSIGTNGIKAEFKNTKGSKVYKNISLASMTKVLNEDAEFDSGFLPLFGKNYMGARRFVKNPDKEILFIEACPALRTVKYGREERDHKVFQNVAFPGLLLAALCTVERSGKLVFSTGASRLYATAGPILRETDGLYSFPFGNVYTDGRICWGNTDPCKGVSNLTQVGAVLDTFLYGLMNDDLYSGSMGLQSTLKSLENSSYPYETLKKTDLNFRDLVSLMKSKNVR